MTNKYSVCTSTKMFMQPLKIAKCTLKKRHEDDHTDGKETWSDADHRDGPR